MCHSVWLTYSVIEIVYVASVHGRHADADDAIASEYRPLYTSYWIAALK